MIIRSHAIHNDNVALLALKSVNAVYADPLRLLEFVPQESNLSLVGRD
jgi:hypothetical protein